MTRPLPSGMPGDLTGPTVRVYYAIDLQFDDEDGTRYNQPGYAGNRAVRLWTGYDRQGVFAPSGSSRLITSAGNIFRSSDTFSYTGAGSLLSVDVPSEVSDLSAQGATLTLSGAVSSIVSLALSEPYVARRGRILLGTDSGTVEVFGGLIDRIDPTDSGEDATITVRLESLNVLLQRPNLRRYTASSQKTRVPWDTFFDYATTLPDAQVPWGRRA